PTEALTEKPSIRYTAGVLFPPESVVDESSEAGGLATDPEEQPRPEAAEPINPDEERILVGLAGGADGADEAPDDAVTLANTYKPSAIALSFVVAGGVSRLTIEPSAAVYAKAREEGAERPVWRRRDLVLPAESFSLQSTTRFGLERTVAAGLRLRL